MSGTPITPRRSRRGQHFVSSEKLTSGKFRDLWTDEPLLTRPTQRPKETQDQDDDFNEEEDLRTTFYPSFTRRPLRRTMGKGRTRDPDDDDIRFEIGDTIIINGGNRSANDSVAVITAFWQVESVEKDMTQDELEFNMKAQIHWFIRQNQRPTNSAPRDDMEGEIFYSTNQSAIIPLYSIQEKCKVVEPEDYDPMTIRDRRTFMCRNVYHQGIYGDFNWSAHAETAKNASLRNPEDSQHFWLCEITSRPTKKKIQPRARKTAQRRRQDSDEERNKTKRNTRSKQVPSDTESDDVAEVESDQSDDSGDASVSGSVLNDEEDDDHSLEPDSSEDGGDGTEEEPMSDVEYGRTSRASSRTGKRKRTTRDAVSTPLRKRVKPTRALPTPNSKAALAKRKSSAKKKVRLNRGDVIGSTQADRQALMKLPKDPHLRAMHLLHVAARPDALPGRDQEFDEVLLSIVRVLEEESGGCIYISGVPGTGKTATVHAVVKELKRMAANNETNPFTYVEINGLRLPEPSAAYAVLWEAVSGHDASKEGHLKISPKEALKRLDRYFNGGRSGPTGGAFVVLMDELDQLVTAKQDVVYNFFNWPNLPQSKLVVIAVSNTHDLPERVMTGKVRSRLGMEKIQFQPYSREQLVNIVNSRLTASREGLDIDTNVMSMDAVTFASARVAAVNGDARRVLDISRRAVELAYNPEGKSKIIGMQDVASVIKAMQNSPTAAYLKECSFVERLVLAALLKCMKREGINEIKWGNVMHQSAILFDQLGDADMTKPNQDRLRSVLKSLIASKAVIAETGLAAERKLVSDRLLILNLESGEVTRALCDVGGDKWANLMGAS
ncbi:Origin recognition complex, subunit 1 [Tulasnella sp. 419]|nr:Origin recognition complex, subunit 1 [Tulasnella sp. 419]